MLLETCKVKSVSSTYVEVRGGKKLVHGHKIWQEVQVKKISEKGDVLFDFSPLENTAIQLVVGMPHFLKKTFKKSSPLKDTLGVVFQF